MPCAVKRFLIRKKTVMALNIGVTGHRFLPDAQLSALSGQIGKALDELRLIAGRIFMESKDRYAGDAPILRVISMLAEGSDQLAAEAGVARGFQLQCVFPMERRAYLDTIASDSAKIRLKELSAAADAVFEIGCASDVAPRAFLNGGQVMLGHSDVLIAVWDGKDAGKIGWHQQHGKPGSASRISPFSVSTRQPRTTSACFITVRKTRFGNRGFKMR